MPDWSAKANVPQEMRRALGKWAISETSETYTRDLRSKVLRVWKETVDQEHLMTNITLVPQDLNDKHYWSSEQPLKAGRRRKPSADLESTSPITKRLCTEDMATVEDCQSAAWDGNTVTPTKSMADMGESDCATSEEDMDDITEKLCRTYGDDKIPADALPPKLLGPLTPVASIRKNLDGYKRIHLANTIGKSVGCGLSTKKQDCFTEEDWRDLESRVANGMARQFSECGRCFEKYTWPQAWKLSEGTNVQLPTECTQLGDSDKSSASNSGSSSTSESSGSVE